MTLPYGKPLHKMPKYEDCKEQHMYAITLSPDDSWQYFCQEDRLTKFVKTFTNLYYKIKSTNYIYTVIEISSNGRLHVHGHIRILNKKMFYLDHLHLLQTFGSCYIEDPPEKWDEYMKKQEGDFGSIHTHNDFTYSKLDQFVYEQKRPKGKAVEIKSKPMKLVVFEDIDGIPIPLYRKKEIIDVDDFDKQFPMKNVSTAVALGKL